MHDRVLVCVLAQTRAHQLTWPSFKKHVIDELNADLAVCIGIDAAYDYRNPFWTHAKYRWTVPEYDDYGDGFDWAQRCLLPPGTPNIPDWRILLQVKNEWLGGINGREAHQGSGGILIFFRWLLLKNIMEERILQRYDRFIITRADFHWSCPHPPLSLLRRELMWFPDGEFYGGITDRHVVVSSEDVESGLSLIDNLLIKPNEIAKAMCHWQKWNIEQYMLFHLIRRGVFPRVGLFPYVMFSVRGSRDQTRGMSGEFNEELGLIVKYKSEWKSAKTYEGLVRSGNDWEALAKVKPQLFHLMLAPRWINPPELQAMQPDDEGQAFHGDKWPFSDLVLLHPVRTHHGSVLFVREGDRSLRHGPPGSSPRNLALAVYGKRACFAHIDEKGELVVLDIAETAESRFNITAKLPVFSLSMNGLFLCAEPDGAVTLSREQEDIWERFTVGQY
jgi:hypothetical protein